MDPLSSTPAEPAPAAVNDPLQLGEYQHLCGDLVAIADALKVGDKQRAHGLLKKFSSLIDKPMEAEKSDEELEKEKLDRAMRSQAESATTSRNYRERVFPRALPTKPEIPEAVNYDTFFSRG